MVLNATNTGVVVLLKDQVQLQSSATQPDSSSCVIPEDLEGIPGLTPNGTHFAARFVSGTALAAGFSPYF